VDVAVDLTLVDGQDGGIHVGIARQQHARRAGPARAHLGQQARAVHAGHAHVADHHIHRLGFEQGQRLGATASGEDAAAFGAQHPAQRRQDAGLVVDAQHRPGRWLGGFGGRGSAPCVDSFSRLRLPHRQGDAKQVPWPG
jgi:hypothetical protein